MIKIFPIVQSVNPIILYVFIFKSPFKSLIERTMAVQERDPILPQTETISNYQDKQQTRTFHRLVKGSGLNALVRVTGLEPARA